MQPRTNSVLRTNNVFYGGGAVACYEVGIKRDHRHSAILSLRTDALMSYTTAIVFLSTLKCVTRKYIVVT